MNPELQTEQSNPIGNRYSVSRKNAEKIYEQYLSNKTNDKPHEISNVMIIAVSGSWGTGKSSTKDQLIGFIEDNPEDLKNRIIVNYDVLPFEEHTQVTSELYNSIAKNCLIHVH
jgi:hypothetical protein